MSSLKGNPYQPLPTEPPKRMSVSPGGGIQDSRGSTFMNDSQPLLFSSNQFILYPRRWFMLFLVVITSLSNVMLWISFSPIADIAEAYYDTSATIIDLLSTVYQINFILLSLPTSWLIGHKGLRFSLLVGALLSMLGATTRALGDFLPDSSGKLGILFLGQVLAAAAQPVVLSCPTVLAGMWFGENERAVANMLGSIANPVGVALGTVISAHLVSSASDIRLMLWVYASPCIASFFLVLFFFQDRPPTPPSLSAGQKSEAFMSGLGSVVKNKMYLLLLLSFGIGVGSTSSVSTLSGQIVGGQGFSAVQTSLFFGVLLGCGLVGAVVSGKVVDKTKKFTEVLRASFGFATLAFLMFTLVLPEHEAWLVCISTGFMGFFCFAALPVALELSVECTYPVSESTSAGLMWLTGQLFGIIITFCMDGLTGGYEVSDKYPVMTNSCWFVTGAAGLAAVLLLFFKTEYHRLSVDMSVPSSPLAIDQAVYHSQTLNQQSICK